MNDIANLIATDQIQVELSVRIGAARLSVAEISRLRPDDILTLDQDVSDGVELCVGDKVIAHGELATTDASDGRLCVRITGAAQAG